MRKLICIVMLVYFFCGCKTRPGMPVFDVLLKDSTTVLNTRQIPEGRPILLFYFSPDCDHCQAETDNLLKNIDSLDGVRLYFITSDEFSRMKVYDKHYKIYNHQNIVLGRDFRNALANHFNIMSPPFSALYNKNKKLIAVFAGETTVSDLLPHLKSL